MKKIKFISLLLVIVMVVGLFSGCNKTTVTQKDLEADPKVFIESGLKKSFAKSPFGSLLELKDTEATSLSLLVKPEDEDLGYIDASVVFANNKLSALLELDANLDGEKYAGKLFLDSENLAIQIDELKDIFGTDSVGIGLKDLEKSFKESAWYELIKESGLEEEFKAEMEAEGLDKIDFDAIIKAYEQYLENLESMVDDYTNYTVSEVTIENGKKKVKCFEIKETVSKNIVSKMEETVKDFYEDFANAIGVDSKDLGLDADAEMDDEVKAVFEELVKNYSTTYVIDQNTGAVRNINMSVDVDMSDIESLENEDTKVYSYLSIDFGGDPTNTFTPSFDFSMHDGSSTTKLIGKSSIDKENREFVLNVNYSMEYDDEDWKDWNEEYKMYFTLNEDSQFKMELSDDDDKVSFGGRFKIENAKLLLEINDFDVEDAEIGQIVIEIDFNAKSPSCFDYEDILQWDDLEIAEFLEQIGASSIVDGTSEESDVTHSSVDWEDVDIEVGDIQL